MTYYEFYYSCGDSNADARESKYYAFSGDWYDNDIENFFEEELENYARRHSNLACFPDPADYYSFLDYDMKYNESYEDWLNEIRIYSFFEECDADEWEAYGGEEII